MRAIKIFILCLLLASNAYAAEKKSGKHKEAARKEAAGKEAAKPAAEPVAVQPTFSGMSVYPEREGYLPRNYQGADPKKFWEFFKERASYLQKEEFETPEEFARRKADIDSVLSPLKASELYAFWKPDVIVWYDKVSQYYVFRSKDNEVFCDETAGEWNTCRLATVENSRSSYLGNFPQGMATVKRTKVTDFSLAIRKANPIFSSPAFIYEFSRMGFEYLVKLPPETSIKLRGKRMGVLFVGSVAGTEIVAGKANVSPPTFEDPTDYVMQEEALPFDLKKLVFYVVDTGQVLAVKDIQP